MREGLPLRRADWEAYLRWAVDAFRLATAGARDTTQVHTHMCYADFGDILSSIVEMDADVISIETSRSNMELLRDFKRFDYPNEVGPGVYDIHSPRIPAHEEMVALLEHAAQVLDVSRIWVNPDCGTQDAPMGAGRTRAQRNGRRGASHARDAPRVMSDGEQDT